MNTFRTLYTVVALLLGAVVATAQTTGLGIDSEEATSVGIYIKEIATGRVLVDHNSQLALTPASVMKAITTASALSLQGAESKFETSVAIRGRRDGSRLHGDLVINSCGDPTLESSNFRSRLGFCDSIVAALRAHGIDAIEGSIVVRQTLKDPGPLLTWEIEDVAWPYGAGLYGLNWRDNTVTVYPNTGRVVPEAPGFSINLIRSNSGNDLVRGIYSDELTVWARNTNRDWGLSTTAPDPAAVFGAQLTNKLRGAGISVGEAALTAATDAETVIYTHASAPFGEIMRSLMVRSDNLFAEGMLRSLAPNGRRKDAINRERELWSSRGISTKCTIIQDGSGLSRSNRLSPRFIAEVLEYMAKSPQGMTYSGFFPRAGKDGTMRGMLAKSRLMGRIALKTGSVSSVQCYAGYKLDSANRPTHVIVVMVNGFFCPRAQVRKATERLLENTFL